MYNSYSYGYGPRPYGGFYAGYTNPFYANTPWFASPARHYVNPFFAYNRPYAIGPIFDYYRYQSPANYYGFNFGFRYQQPYQYNLGNYYSFNLINYSIQRSIARSYSSNPYESSTSSTSSTSSSSSTRRTRTPRSKRTKTTTRTTSGTPPTVSKAIHLAKQELQKGVHETREDNSTRIIEYRTGSENPEKALPWCASFVSWLYGAGQDRTCPFGYSQSSGVIKDRAIEAGYYARANSGYKPKVGDLMIIQYPKKDGKYQGGHVGIVVEVHSDGTYVTIEGNYSDKVARVNRSMNTEHLHGFVKMNEWIKNS